MRPDPLRYNNNNEQNRILLGFKVELLPLVSVNVVIFLLKVI